MLQNISKNKKAFTIIEILISLGIVSMGLLGILALVQQNLQVETINRDYLVASNLAQEGLELVRNIRDQNWFLPGNEWDKYIYNATDPTYFSIDYRGSTTIKYINNADPISAEEAHLYLENITRFYVNDNTSPNESTRFYRLISINKTNDHELRVTCEVKWRERGRDHSYVVDTLLFDWR